jgi:type I restriction enzyme S subunit
VRPGYKQTEVGVIPEEWAARPCAELSDRIMVGVVIRPTQYYVRHGIPAFRSANIREDGISDLDFVFISEKSNALLAKSQTRAGDVLTVRTGYPGTSAVVRPRHAGANCIDILITRPSASALDSDYLAIWVNSSFGKKQVLRNQGGNAQKHFNVGDMRNLIVAVPPLPEQRAIAAALSDVDALLGGLDRLIAKKRDLKQAAMQQLLTGQSRLPGFHGDWSTKPLGEVAVIVMGQSPDSKNYNRTGEGVPLIQGNADIENRYSIARVWTTQITKEGRAGDLLLTVRAPVGAVGRISERCCLGRGVCSLKTSGDADFLFHALVFAEPAWKVLEQGSTFTSANSAQVTAFSIPVPVDPAEQAAIAEVLTEMDAELTALEQRQEKTRALKRAMMQELLCGKTRFVTPEPVLA